MPWMAWCSREGALSPGVPSRLRGVSPRAGRCLQEQAHWNPRTLAKISASISVHVIHRTRFGRSGSWRCLSLGKEATTEERRPGMRAMTTVVRRWRGTARELGMSTAEYAVGTIAAAAFAGLLFKIVTSPEVRNLLLGIIKKALQLAG